MHAELKVGDSFVMLGEAMRDSPTSATYYDYVQDADAAYRAALSAGGESLEAPTDRFWGDRVATIKDFAGNKWMIATHVEDVSADELERRARKLMAA
jgi:PhnB protein